MIIIKDNSEITREMEKVLRKLISQYDSAWEQIQDKFQDIFDCKVEISILQRHLDADRQLEQKPQKASDLSRDESAYLWLFGLKGCSTQMTLTALWPESRMKNLEDLKREFLRMFIRGLIQVNQILGYDKQRNTEIIKNTYDQAIFNTIRLAKLESNDQQFTAMKHIFMKMLTVLTYVNVTVNFQIESLKSFCSSNEFETMISDVQEMNYMVFIANKSLDKSSGLAGSKQFRTLNTKTITKLQKSQTFNVLFQSPSFNPFLNEETLKKIKIAQYKQEDSMLREQEPKSPQQEQNQDFELAISDSD